MGLHDLAERPERDAVAVREAAALPPEDELRPVVDPVAELGEQPGLADARLARHGDELDLRLADHALERVLEQPQLAVAADERRRRGLDVDAEAASRFQGSPQGHGLGLALDGDGIAAPRRGSACCVARNVCSPTTRLPTGAAP